MEQPLMKSTYVAFRAHALKKHGINAMLQSLCSHGIQRGFSVVELKTKQLTVAQVETLYEEHKGKPFFPKLVKSMTEGPVCLVRIEFPVYSEGDIKEFIAEFRKCVIGATDPNEALPGTIRFDFGDKAAYKKGESYNACHSPSSPEAIDRELPMFFWLILLKNIRE